MTDTTTPTEPGIYRTRHAGALWELWRGWDGRHWSRGCWTRTGAEEFCAPWLRVPCLMPRDERETRQVVRWRV